MVFTVGDGGKGSIGGTKFGPLMHFFEAKFHEYPSLQRQELKLDGPLAN